MQEHQNLQAAIYSKSHKPHKLVLLDSLTACIKLITKRVFFILYMTQFIVTTQPNVNVSCYFNPPENIAHIKEEVIKRQTDMDGISSLHGVPRFQDKNFWAVENENPKTTP